MPPMGGGKTCKRSPKGAAFGGLIRKKPSAPEGLVSGPVSVAETGGSRRAVAPHTGPPGAPKSNANGCARGTRRERAHAPRGTTWWRVGARLDNRLCLAALSRTRSSDAPSTCSRGPYPTAYLSCSERSPGVRLCHHLFRPRLSIHPFRVRLCHHVHLWP